ncbi:hypothetical protein D3C79_782940 [compost metagenome]
MIETVILHAGKRQTQVAAVPTATLAGIPVIDAALATGHFQPRTLAVDRFARKNIDHCHQCVGAIADGIGTAKDLDALDIFHGQGDVAPVHRGQPRAVHRAAVDQHLHAPGVVSVTAVVVDGGLVASAVADHHPRHQAQQFGYVAGAAGADQCAVEHGHAAWHGRR